MFCFSYLPVDHQLLMKSPGICGIKINEDQQYPQSLHNTVGSPSA